MNCLVHRVRMLYAADYCFSLHNYFFFHYCVGLCRIHLSLNNRPNGVYALPIVGLHALRNSPRILTAGLQAHISTRSVYLHIV